VSKLVPLAVNFVGTSGGFMKIRAGRRFFGSDGRAEGPTVGGELIRLELLGVSVHTPLVPEISGFVPDIQKRSLSFLMRRQRFGDRLLHRRTRRRFILCIRIRTARPDHDTSDDHRSHDHKSQKSILLRVHQSTRRENILICPAQLTIVSRALPRDNNPGSGS